MTDVVLLTGASGYLGRRLAHRFLDTSDVQLVLPVRSKERREEVVTDLGPGAARVEFVECDLESPDAFRFLNAEHLRRVTSIVHAAAVTRFNVERSLGLATNVAGTAQVLEVARRCDALESFDYLSTVYATGLQDGLLPETVNDKAPRFTNTYEESKWMAEQLVAECDDLPWRILRVSTVLADDDTGAVSQYNAVHDTLKLYFYGLLSLLPGRADTPLYFVTGDFVTDAIVALGRAHAPRGVYHLAHSRQEAVCLDQLIDLAFDAFSQADDFRRKRILRPLLADEESFTLLVEGVSPIAGGLVRSALGDVAPFARQLYVSKDVDNSRLREALPSHRFPDTPELVSRTCEHLVTTRWGRR